MEGEELIVKRIILIGDDGARTVVDAYGFTTDGGPGRGRIVVGFAGDGAPLVDLYSPEGAASLKLRACNGTAGVIATDADGEATINAAGFSACGPCQSLAIGRFGLLVTNPAGETLLNVPFLPVTTWLGTLLDKVKAFLPAA
jgi:hypothetical protein